MSATVFVDPFEEAIELIKKERAEANITKNSKGKFYNGKQINKSKLLSR